MYFRFRHISSLSLIALFGLVMLVAGCGESFVAEPASAKASRLQVSTPDSVKGPSHPDALKKPADIFSFNASNAPLPALLSGSAQSFDPLQAQGAGTIRAESAPPIHTTVSLDATPGSNRSHQTTSQVTAAGPATRQVSGAGENPLSGLKDPALTPGSQEQTPSTGFQLLGTEFHAGTLTQTTWSAGESLHGANISTPVLVARGAEEGQTLCVTAAVHGDELNGIEAVRRLMYSIKPKKLKGMVIGVPIVNLQGFQRHSRYLPDRRDLNRFFPGRPKGSAAARMAFSFFNDIVRHCDGLVDLHTGSFHRTNLPQLRADLNNTDVMALTKGFGATVILHSPGGKGTLRQAAVAGGIPAVTLEAGEPLRVQENAVKHTVKALFTLLDTLHMYNKHSLWGNPEPTYYRSEWVRADQGGILFSNVKLGRRVKQGELLGKVTDPITNEQSEILAPHAGRVIGLALNQFVMPGFATYHIARSHKAKRNLPDTPLENPASDSTPAGDHYENNELDLADAEPFSGDDS